MNEMEKLYRQAQRYKVLYPEGTRIYLNYMDDPHAPVPAGTRGTVDFVDDIGQLQMSWDNGRTLALVPGVDDFRKLTEKELAEENKEASVMESPVTYDLYESKGLSGDDLRKYYRGITGLDNDKELSDKEVYAYLLDALKEHEPLTLDDKIRRAAKTAAMQPSSQGSEKTPER